MLGFAPLGFSPLGFITTATAALIGGSGLFVTAQTGMVSDKASADRVFEIARDTAAFAGIFTGAVFAPINTGMSSSNA